MARGGVSYSDIAKAAESIKNTGKNPTVDRVLNMLGTGSKSTIGPHLKAWKETKSEQNDASDLPTGLITAVKELYQRLQSEADSRIENSERIMAAQKIQHTEEIERLTNEIDQLTKRVTELQQIEANLTADNTNLNKALDKANLRIVHLESKKESNEQMILELRKSKDEIHQQLKQAHEQQEHYQLKIAEERTLERNESQAVRANLNKQIADQAQQIIDANERYSKSQKHVDLLSERNQNLSDKFHSLERDAVRKEAVIHSFEKQLAQYEVKLQESLVTNKELNKVQFSQSNQISALSSECAIIKDYLTVAHKNIESIQSRYEAKAEEYLELMQEKKFLEKQLLALQNSIQT